MVDERIKKLRKENKLSQAKLAAILNITQQAVATWENGIFEPDRKNLISLAQIFDVDINYLLGITDVRRPYQNFEEYNRKGLEKIYKEYGIKRKSWITLLESNGDTIKYEVPEENLESIKILLDKLANRQE